MNSNNASLDNQFSPANISATRSTPPGNLKLHAAQEINNTNRFSNPLRHIFLIARRNLGLIGLGLAALCSIAPASAQQRMEPIPVTAGRLPGVCYGGGCVSVFNQLAEQFKIRNPNFEERGAELSDSETKLKVCQALAKTKPPNCARTRPSIAGFDGAGGNRCGSGIVSRTIATIGGYALITNYSGSPDEPVLGFNFLASCNTHDICYAQQSPRPTCDTNFSDSMRGVCGANSDCLLAATLYTAAVRTSGGSAYIAAGENLQCYIWHKEMDENGCGAQKSATFED